MSVSFSEEMKEALLKSKGQEVYLLVQIKENKWTAMPQLFTREGNGDEYKLKPFLPLEEPLDVKEALIAEIMPKIKESLHKDIEQSIEAALKEKSVVQLEGIKKSSENGAKIRRTRGCFWLSTENEEILL